MKAQTQSKLILIAAIMLIIGFLIGYGTAYLVISPGGGAGGAKTQPTGTSTTTTAGGGAGTTTTPSGTTTPQKVTLKVIGPWSGTSAEYFRAVINNFTAKYPNIQIDYIAKRAEDLAKTVPLQFAAGKTPADVIITPWAWWIVEMAKKGYVVDVSNLINPDDYIGGIIDKVTYNGKIYGAPFTMWLKPGFWYRKSFFQQHGLSEPKTWDDFLNLLNQIKSIQGIQNPIVTGDGVGWPESDIVEHFLITFGGPELQYKLINCSVKFNDPEVKDILANRLVPLIKNGDFSEPVEWTQAVDEWWAGKYALYFMGTWITGRVEDPNDLDFFPLPGAKGVVGGADYGFIPKFTDKMDAAKTFLKFIATEGQMYHVAGPAGKIPTYKKISVDKLWKPMQSVYQKILNLHMQIVPDLDDSVGGDWQTLFWDQLKLLWANPDQLDQILDTLTQQHPACSSS